jgi:tetratricopeptide (TPR) repeat protein
MRCGERLPSELDPILLEITRLVDQLKTRGQKGQAYLQPDPDFLLGKLGAFMRDFVEIKKRMLVGIPEVDRPTIATVQRVECAFAGIPDDYMPLILTKVLDVAANATKSLSEIKKVNILGRLAATLTLLGLEQQGSELFAKLIKIADRSTGHTKADMYAFVAWALNSTSRKDEAVKTLDKAISQANNSRDYSNETAEIAALMGRTDEAIELTKKEKPEYERARALAQIARNLALKGMMEEATRTLNRALEIADGITGRLSKARAQTGLAGAFVLVGPMADAIDMADRIAVKSQRLGALMNVAESLAMQGKTLEAMKIVKEKFEATGRKSALARVAGAAALSKGPDEAISLSREIHDRFYLDSGVRPKLVRALAFSGRIIEAVEIMNSIPIRESEERAKALADIAEAFTLPNAPVYQGLVLF